jgi:hypothetical protein
MHDGHQDRNHKNQGQLFRPPAWLSTEELEEELLRAIQASAGEADEALMIIDEYFLGDDAFEPEPQHRQVLLWLLSLLRPRLADLLSCPPEE